MAKEKVTLTGRKRTKDLKSGQQIQGSDNKLSRKKQDELLRLKQQSEQHQQMGNGNSNQYIDEIVLVLLEKYQIWSEPLDNYRYRYSPNKRSHLLLNEIKCILNDHANKLFAEGYQENTCKNKCFDLLNIISDRLRKHGVPIGALHLKAKK